jgi:hypothetical protein
MAFIIATLHSIGRVADREPARAALLLSLAFFIIMYNGLESIWVRGFEFMWVVFLIVAAETARSWRPLRRGGRSQQARRYSPGHGRPRPVVAGASWSGFSVGRTPLRPARAKHSIGRHAACSDVDAKERR